MRLKETFILREAERSKDIITFYDFARMWPSGAKYLQKMWNDQHWFPSFVRSIPLKDLLFSRGHNDGPGPEFWRLDVPRSNKKAYDYFTLPPEEDETGDNPEGPAGSLYWDPNKRDWIDQINGYYQRGWVGGDVLNSRPDNKDNPFGDKDKSYKN